MKKARDINIKNILIVFLIAFISANSFGQNFKYINKAERLIDANIRLDRALKLLDKAEKVDYGFCGNSRITAFWHINYLKARVYYKKKELKLALTHLDSINGCMFGGNCKKSDSLKYKIIGELYGKKKVLTLLKNLSDSVITYTDVWMERNICLHLDSIDYNFCFSFDPIIFKNNEKLTLNKIFIKMNIYGRFE